MEIGDRVKVTSDRFSHFGNTGTVLKITSFYICVALDGYPNVNWRDYHNRIWFEPEELEVMGVGFQAR